MDFVRREENKLYELIDSLSQEEIAKLEEQLTLVATLDANGRPI